MDSGSLRVAFLVQGEGRGHLSQALALREMLEARGHRVVGVLAGTSERRPLPSHFAQGMGMEPLCFPSPTTVPGRRGTGVSMPRTVAYNVRRLPRGPPGWPSPSAGCPRKEEATPGWSLPSAVAGSWRPCRSRGNTSWSTS